MNEYKDGRMRGWINEWMNEYTDGRMNGRMRGWINEWMNEYKDGRMNGPMRGWMNEWMNGWLSEWKDGRMNGRMRGMMDEWMNERMLNIRTISLLYADDELRLNWDGNYQVMIYTNLTPTLYTFYIPHYLSICLSIYPSI